jgi:hypothetical protein
LNGWTATVSESASNEARAETTRQNWLELVETLPSLHSVGLIVHVAQSKVLVIYGRYILDE